MSRKDSTILPNSMGRSRLLGWCLWDLATASIVQYSPQINDFFGIPKEGRRITLEQFLDRVHPDDRQRFGAQVEALSANAERTEFSYRIIGPNNEIRTFLEVSEPAINSHSQVTRRMAVLQDLTDDEVIVEQFTASQKAIAETQRLANLGVWRWSIIDNQLLEASEELARIHGVSRTELRPLIKNQMERVIHPEDRARVEREFKKFDRDGTDFTIEYRILRPSGEIRHVREIGSCIRDNSGQPTEQIGTLQDITDQKIAEIELKETHAQFEHAERMVNIHHWIADSEMENWFHSSKNAEHMFGAKLEDLHGGIETFLSFIHPDDRERLSAEFKEWAKNPQPASVTYRVIREDGEVRHWHDSSEPVFDSNGSVKFFRGTTQDITKQKVTEEELQEIRTQFEHAERIANLEPRRVCRRLPTLRRWSHDEDLNKIFTGSARAFRADGAGSSG